MRRLTVTLAAPAITVAACNASEPSVDSPTPATPSQIDSAFVASNADGAWLGTARAPIRNLGRALEMVLPGGTVVLADRTHRSGRRLTRGDGLDIWTESDLQ